MGFQNPEIPWRELERRLSGRPDPASSSPAAYDLNGNPREPDGGDSPAWSRKRAHYEPAELQRTPATMPYAELHAHSSFSFLDGASSPEELAEEAARLGLTTLTL